MKTPSTKEPSVKLHIIDRIGQKLDVFAEHVFTRLDADPHLMHLADMAVWAVVTLALAFVDRSTPTWWWICTMQQCGFAARVLFGLYTYATTAKDQP